jgi:ATP-dependent DNA helicase RecG
MKGMNQSPTSNGMPFNLDDLIHRRAIEGNRVEFKATWNRVIEPAVVQTVCAFANDLLNLNGGYVVLGIEEEGGRPTLPPRGLDDLDLDLIQKEVYGACKRISPDYPPMLFPGDYQGKAVLVIWAPGGDNRPYQAPDSMAKGASRDYYVRQGPMSVAAKGEVFRQLMEGAAKIPFDDRRSLHAKREDISPTLVRRFLHQVKSDILNVDPPVSDYDLYRKLRIVAPVNAHEVPRNVGLLFFHEDPDQFFPGARIEVVLFRDNAAGDVLAEWTFLGPLPYQVHETLQILKNIGGELVIKFPDRAEAERTFTYPFGALEEAVVNAVYHRGYDGPPEPTKVYIYPDRIEIINYPGPVAGVQADQLLPGHPGPVAPARNRRIGEFLKELRLAEARGTGIPKIQRKMMENGSPEPIFDFDDARTYYRTILRIHPKHFDMVMSESKKTP